MRRSQLAILLIAITPVVLVRLREPDVAGQPTARPTVTTPQAVEVTSPTTISANTTYARNQSVSVKPGGTITVAAGCTLTILGPFEAPPVPVFDGPGKVRFVDPTSALKSNPFVTVRPEWFGVVGDKTFYPVRGASGGSQVTLTQDVAVPTGQPVVVRGGRRSTPVHDCAAGWMAADPADAAVGVSHEMIGGRAAVRLDVLPGYEVGRDVGRVIFPTPVDLTGCTELRAAVRFVPGANCSAGQRDLPLRVTLLDAAGKPLSFVGPIGPVTAQAWAMGDFGAANTWFRCSVPLPQIDLSAVGGVSVALDRLRPAKGNTLSQEGANMSGAVATSGVGITFWLSDIRGSDDLRTTVTGQAGRVLTLADPLGATVPADATRGPDGLIQDDVPALRRAFDATPDFGTMRFTLRPVLGQPFRLDSREGMRWEFAGGMGSGVNQTTPTPGFYWAGNSTEVALVFNRCRGFRCQSFAVVFEAKAAAGGLLFDHLTPAGKISTDMGFDEVVLHSMVPVEWFYGAANSLAARTNCEFLAFNVLDVRGNLYGGRGTGFGFINGASFNAKSIRVGWMKGGGLAKNIWIQNGSFWSGMVSGYENGVSIQVDNCAEPVVIDGVNEEFPRTPIVVNGGGAPLYVRNARFASVTTKAGGGVFYVKDGTGLVIQGANVSLPPSTNWPVGVTDYTFGRSGGGAIHSSFGKYPCKREDSGLYVTRSYSPWTSYCDQFVGDTFARADGSVPVYGTYRLGPVPGIPLIRAAAAPGNKPGVAVGSPGVPTQIGR
jgi:hypothetical protein